MAGARSIDTARLVARRAAVEGYSLAVTRSYADRRRLGRMPERGQALILNLHSVEPPGSSAVAGLDPRVLDEFLVWLKRHARIVTIAELVAEAEGREPYVVLSFDDGYRDFAVHALPVLERHGVRANQNIVPECVESGRPPWNVELLDALATLSPERLAGLADLAGGLRAGLALAAPERFAELFTLQLKEQPGETRQGVLQAVTERFPELADAPPRPMLTSDEVRQIARDHEIGAHSFAHESMGLESADYFEEDLDRCSAWFDRHGLPLRLYAFPNGSYRAEQLEIAAARGIHTLLVDERPAERTAAALPRLTMFGRSARELRARMAHTLR